LSKTGWSADVGESESGSESVGVSVVERVYARRMYGMFFWGDVVERRPNPGVREITRKSDRARQS
jgi:hypothetical protein